MYYIMSCPAVMHPRWKLPFAKISIAYRIYIYNTHNYKKYFITYINSLMKVTPL